MEEGELSLTFMISASLSGGVLQQSRALNLIQASILALPVFKMNRPILSLIKCPNKIMKKLVLKLL